MNNDAISRPNLRKAPSSSEVEESSGAELSLPGFYDEANTLPAIAQLQDAEAYNSQTVRLVGQYVERDVRMKRVGAPRYEGHVAIVLSDKTPVSLFPIWHKEARRPQAEIDRFKDRNVEVIGTFYCEAPTDPRGGASPLSPCLTDIQALYCIPDES